MIGTHALTQRLHHLLSVDNPVGAKRRELREQGEMPGGYRERACKLWARIETSVAEHNRMRGPEQHEVIFTRPDSEPDQDMSVSQYKVWYKGQKVFSCRYCEVYPQQNRTVGKERVLYRTVCEAPK